MTLWRWSSRWRWWRMCCGIRWLRRAAAIRYLQDWPLNLAYWRIAIAAGLVGGIYPPCPIRFPARRGSYAPTSRAIPVPQPAFGAGGVQFAVSIGLGIAAIVVFQQIDFARHVDLGFPPRQYRDYRHRWTVVAEAFRFSESPGKGPASWVEQRPPRRHSMAHSVLPPETGRPAFLSPTHFAVSPDYFSLYGIKILAGVCCLTSARRCVLASRTIKTLPRAMKAIMSWSMRAGQGVGLFPAILSARRLSSKVAYAGGGCRRRHADRRCAHTGGADGLCVSRANSTGGLSIRVDGRVPRKRWLYRKGHPFLRANVAMQHTFLDDTMRSFIRPTRRGHDLRHLCRYLAIFIACLGLVSAGGFSRRRGAPGRSASAGVRGVTATS